MNPNELSVDAGRRHYYSSSQGPFYNANNIFMFYGGGDRGNTVEGVIRCLRMDSCMVHVHGERGSGKTMLSLVISDRLKHRYNIIRYDIPDISAPLLLRHFLIELLPRQADLISAQQAQVGSDLHFIDEALDDIVGQLIKAGRKPNFKPLVLIIDSQAELDVGAHRILDTLTALKVNDRSVIQCIVFHRVTEQHFRGSQVDPEHTSANNHFWLRRLNLAEINEYLRHHMMLFDFNRRDLFTREMAYFIADRSEGQFRSINTLARNAFTIANLENADKLSMSHLLMAGLPPREEKSTESRLTTKFRGLMIALITVCVVASLSIAVVIYL